MQFLSFCEVERKREAFSFLGLEVRVEFLLYDVVLFRMEGLCSLPGCINLQDVYDLFCRVLVIHLY